MKVIEKFKAQSKKGKIQFVAVVLLLLGCVLVSRMLQHEQSKFKKEGSVENKILVEVEEIAPKTQSIIIEETGTVKARNLIGVIPQVTGRVEKVSPGFRSGSQFKAKEILFQIEPVDFKLRVDNADANYKRALTEYKIEKAEGESAIKEWNSLNPEKPIPNLVARRPQLSQANANLKSAKAALKEAELNLSRSSFSLPYDGRVVNSTIEVGQYIVAGQKYGELYTLESVEIEVPIDRKSLKWLEAGNTKAEVELRLGGEMKKLSCLVQRISAELDPLTRFSKIYVTPDKENIGKLAPGTFVNVKIFGPKIINVWKIPNKAIREEKTIWVLKGASLAKISPDFLSIGKSYSLAKGTKENLKLVTSNVLGFTEGAKAEIIE